MEEMAGTETGKTGRMARGVAWFVQLPSAVKGVITTVEFGLSAGCVWAAWTAGGDMALVIPALILGLLFAVTGIATVAMGWRRTILSMVISMVIFLGIGGFLYSHFQPKDSQPVALPPILAPTSQTREIISTYAQIYYRCKTDVVPTQKAIEKNSANFKRYMEVMADTFGYKADFVHVIDGDKVDLIPNSPHRKKRSWFLNKMSFEIRRVGKYLIGVSTRDYIDNFFIQRWASNHIPPTDPTQIETNGIIADLAGVKRGDCELQ